jgi:colicin import membrane protein
LREHPKPFVFAVLVHAALLAVLVFSLDWTPTVKPGAAHKRAPVQAVAVDASKLESELQRQKQLEQQKQREEQERVERLQKQAQEAERKRQQEEQRLIKLKREKEQAEQNRRKEEARKKAEAEQKRKAEEARKKAEAEQKRKAEEARKKAEAEQKRKQEEARKKAEAERKRKEEEARKKAEAERKRQAEQEMQARLAAEQEREAAQRLSAMQQMVNEYVLYIRDKVQRSWIQPPGSGSDLSCTVEVRLIPSGEVIDAQIVRSSGNAAFDRSVEAAVFKASPLPVPPDPDVMERFRSLRFEFKPGSV